MIVDPTRALTEAESHEVSELITKVAGLFAGHNQTIIGVTLANLLALWCLHHHGQDADATRLLHQELLQGMTADVLSVIPVHEQLVTERRKKTGH